MNFNWLSALAGGTQGASRGLGGVIDILEKADDKKRSDARYKDETTRSDTRYNEEKAYRNQHDALELLQTGKFRMRHVLDAAANERDPNAPSVYGEDDPNAPTVPPTARTPVQRALSLADLEAIPQDELDREALRKRDQLETVLDTHQPWAPHTEEEYERSRRRANASGDAVNEESRAALRDQRISNLRANHVSRAVAGAIGRLQSQGVTNPTPQQIHAAATNELLANPTARKLFLTTGRASDYDQLRDEVWSGLQTRTDKLTHGKKPIADWTPEGDAVDDAPPAPPAATGGPPGDINLGARKTVPDQAAYDALRQRGLSATAIRTRYNLDPSIKRVW
jgi:hypothetical protein